MNADVRKADAVRAEPSLKTEPIPEQQLGWADCQEVERVPGRMSGAWVFRNTRIPLYTLFENLAEGATINEIASWFEGLTVEQLSRVLDHQTRMLTEDRIE